MGIFDKLKKKDQEEVVVKAKAGVDEAKTKPVKNEAEKSVEVKPKIKTEVKLGKKSVVSSGVKGVTTEAHRVLIKPLITEKATVLGGLNKYVFEIDPKMNKVEVKKAIRSIYNVDPTSINISNFSGKKVRYGKVKGQRRGWKKAIVTLRAGDKIEVYEGV